MKSAPPTKLDVQDLRRRIRQADAALAARFWADEDVSGLLAERARFIDAFLAEIWQHWFQHDAQLALFAVGGYGRGELHPHSDIDLLILARKPSAAQEEIAAFVRLLWDLRLDIGHSVRTLADCRREALQDVGVATTMLERRRLAGSARLAAKLDKLLSKRAFWPSRRFFHAKQQEQEERHRQFNDVDYDLEPNIKSSPGGLRDIQTVLWITQRHLGGTRDAEGRVAGAELAELVEGGFLTRLECQWLLDGRRFLWRVRFGLHIVAGRREDRLLFDHQRELAKRFGYHDTDAQLAVERFMHDYYRHVLLLREVNDILLQHFDEAILGPGARKKPRIEPINERFRIHNDYIEVTGDDVFAAHPPALMEMFVLMANRGDIAGVRAATIRLVREHLHLIDDEFRRDARVCASFLELLRAPYTLVSQLTRMRRYGVLGRYIPEFGRVVGQMQHDLFHIYTVDAHTMMVLRQMRRFLQPGADERFPLAARVVRRLPKIELLYIAGLFHDIGKGRGGDHSSLGAEDAALFCKRHGLDADDCALVAWLVREHLTMSATAQRKDITDPQVVNEFATLVGNETRLDYLCALTVADINATNPTLWNSWRATLMGQLYEGTRQALQRGLDTPAERGAKAQARRDGALRELAGGIGEKRAVEIWQGADDGFFLHHSAAQVAAITRAIDGHDLRHGPLVTLLELDGQGSVSESSGAGATEVFLYAEDRDNLFADSVAALDAADLHVVAAHVSTGALGKCFNAYVVLTGDGQRLAVGEAGGRLASSLAKAIAAGRGASRSRSRRVSRQLKHFVLPTDVRLDTALGARTSTLRVEASDRPGLLATLGGLFVELRVNVHGARITTLGERVEDVFEITNRSGRAITHSGHAQTITETIRRRLDEQIALSAA